MKNVLEYLESAEEQFQDEIKIKEPGRSCSYKTLADNARRVGSALAPGLEGRPVAVYMDKGIDALTSLMGVVYAGGFYTMLNPRNSAPRIRGALDVLNTSVLITDREHEEAAREITIGEQVFLIEDLLKNEVNTELLSDIRQKASEDDILYCLFTSGTTGTMKGVTITHRCVLDFMEYFPDMFGIQEDDIIGNQAPFDFDVSVKDIYSAFKTGATLVIIPTNYFMFPNAVLDYICEERVTTLIWSVSALCHISMLKGLAYKVPTDVKRVLFSGETMPLAQLAIWQNALGGAEFVNLYGPTEITCNCLFYRITEKAEDMKFLPLGKAFPGREVFLLDGENHQIKKAGVKGEICVGGDSLSPGYFHADEETNKVFTSDPRGMLQRIYRTGDIGYLTENGDFVFAGRYDFQIKHMGQRIELEEIEQEIDNVTGVDRAVCIYDDAKKLITAYYIGDADSVELYSALASRLPMYMMPARLIRVENLPLTTRGKVDRKALLAKNNLLKLIETEQTPFYVFDTDVLNKRLQLIKAALGKRTKLCYAVKANPLLIGAASANSDFFEVCSLGEFAICQKLGIAPEKIVYSGVYKDSDSTSAVLEAMDGRGIITIESATQLLLLNHLSQKNGKKTDVIIRITTGNQFGIDKEEILNIISDRCAYESLNILGFQLYSGTQKRNLKTIEGELRLLEGIVAEAKKIGFETRLIEYGPGLPANHFADDNFDEEEMLLGLAEALKNMDYAGDITIEMGRFIVSGCGEYITVVGDVKRNAGCGYLITDGGTHHLKYYGQSFGMKQPLFEHISRNGLTGPKEKWTICGALCTSHDVIVRDALLSAPAVGDILIFKNCGDYSITESPVLFLSRDIPAAYCISCDEGLELLRERRSTADLNGAL